MPLRTDSAPQGTPTTPASALAVGSVAAAPLVASHLRSPAECQTIAGRNLRDLDYPLGWHGDYS